MIWLVAWEKQKTGEWVSEPECFSAKKYARKYMKDCRDVILPGNRMALYKCIRSEVVAHSPQENGND